MATTNTSRSTLPVLLSAAIIIGCAVMACGKGSPSVTSDAGDPFCDRYRRFTCASSPTGICDSNGLPADPLSPDLQTIFDQRCLASTTDGAIPHGKTDGNTLGADLSPAGKLLWEWVSPSLKLSSPTLSLAEDRVLVAGSLSEDQTAAYSLASDGHFVWEYLAPWKCTYTCWGGLLPLSVARNGSVLLVGADSDAFVALNPDGLLLWLAHQRNFASGPLAPMVTGDGTAFGGMTNFTTGAHVYQVSLVDGATLWASGMSVSDAHYALLAMSRDGLLVSAAENAALDVFNSTSGVRLWSEPLSVAPTGLALDDRNVYLSFSNQSTLMARSLQGTLLWTVALSGAIGSPVVNAAGNILVLAKSSAQKGYLYEVASSTGAVLNSVSLHFGKADVTPCISGDFRGSSSPVVLASGEVVFIGEDGAPYSVSNTGDVRKIIDAPAVSLADVKDSCSTPVVDARGILYYRVLNRLYSVDTGIGAGLASTPWPKQWRDNQNSSNVGASGDVGGVSPPEGGVGDAPVSGSDGGTASPSDGSGADTPVPGSDGGTVSDAQPDRAGVPPDTGVNPGTLTLSVRQAKPG